ncbi:YiiX/YebB-like N1pC/P60 family cysteine hydrolase [Lentisphaera marina]|uniref:YiiX/YebB-like N1pC/P60 family cysteine hydrolase n=1 Tax=Lentisphaera marina TaxID=1111041 RepID=UPI002366CA5E|nr:YiiX/YebB-like N1pC/P60 family cysteine hydrolase [Lentisphaera marina]MDD7984471.1 YiiX/YebB-like N1pC/P60 family cysteine hydrolase [Lentisphaera marina]
MTEYDKHRNSLETGDIILFSGPGILSAGIKLGSLCKWSHVGMVVRVQNPDIALIYQATPSTAVKDFFLKKENPGVQINVLSHVIETYPGDISLRKLNVERTQEFLDGLSAFRKEIQGRPFEESKWEIILAAYDGPFGSNQEEDLSSLFCSELIAEAYQRMGLLLGDEAGGKLSNEFTPRDFSEKGKIELLLGATLDLEIPLKKT